MREKMLSRLSYCMCFSCLKPGRTEEHPSFDGDAFEHPSFVFAFDSIISNNVRLNKDRLYYLHRYTSGKANDLVKRFLIVNSENANY